MKQYTKHYEISTRPQVKDLHVEELAAPVGGGKAAKRTALAAFPIAGSTKTHVLTSEIQEWKDNYIENALKEWEKWLTDYRLRAQTRPYYEPFTLTDYQNHGL